MKIGHVSKMVYIEICRNNLRLRNNYSFLSLQILIHFCEHYYTICIQMNVSLTKEEKGNWKLETYWK